MLNNPFNNSSINNTSNNVSYLDFHGFDSLSNNHNINLKLIETYQDIFGDPLLWGESYSQQEVEDKLRNELSGNANLRVCVKKSEGDCNQIELLGFCWAQQLNLQGVETAIESIQYYKSLGSPAIRNTLQMILKDEPVIYLHDLGIQQAYRGQIPLQKLICPVVNSLSERSQTHRVFFWSIQESRIFRLAEYAGFELAATVEGIQFFIGNIDTNVVRTICK